MESKDKSTELQRHPNIGLFYSNSEQLNRYAKIDNVFDLSRIIFRLK